MVQLQLRETFHDCSTAASSSDLDKLFGRGGGGGGGGGVHRHSYCGLCLIPPPPAHRCMNVFFVEGGGGGHITNRAFACILCHRNGGHFGVQPQLCTKMAAMAVSKLLLCCDIICKRSIDTVVEVRGTIIMKEGWGGVGGGGGGGGG